MATTFPTIDRAETEERREAATVERAVTTMIAEGPMRQRMARGGTPAAPAPSLNSNGEAFFVFGDSLDDGVSLSP